MGTLADLNRILNAAGGRKRQSRKGFKFVCGKVLSVCADSRFAILGAPLKVFNCCGAKKSLRCAGSRFAEPRSSLTKVLIVAVRSCGCGALIRGLQNLDILCKENGLSLFASCKK